MAPKSVGNRGKRRTGALARVPASPQEEPAAEPVKAEDAETERAPEAPAQTTLPEEPVEPVCDYSCKQARWRRGSRQ